MLFHVIPEAVCILRSRGVFRQVPVYRRNTAPHLRAELYAKWGAGFIMLRTKGGTSRPDVTWEYLEGVQYNERPIGALIEADGYMRKRNHPVTGKPETWVRNAKELAPIGS